MLLELDLLPGSSLGPFSLGMPLSKAVAYVRERKAEYRCVEVKYADRALLKQDVILNFPEHGMHLRFEPSSQRLRLIEVYDVSRMQLRYGKGVLGGASHAATFVRVYELLGPTFAGEYSAASRVYPLQYPGLLFLFPIPPQYAQRCQEQATELPLEFPDDTTPVASRICIYAGTAGSPQEVAEARPPPLPRGSVHCQPVQATIGEGLHFQIGGQRVKFGDSPQDVWSELGCPSSTVSKAADPGVRHTGSRRAMPCPVPADYFYTYADRGLDVLFDGSTHRLKKLVLRTNAPGHANFNTYSKCNFALCLAPSKQANQEDAACSTASGQPLSARVNLPSATDLASYPLTGNRLTAFSSPSEASDSTQVQQSSQGSCPAEKQASSTGDGVVSGAWCAGRPVSETSAASSSAKGLIQGFFNDLVKPTSESGEPPAMGTLAASQEAGWDWGATEWTKSLLDIGSDTFAFSGRDEPEGHEGEGFWGYSPRTPSAIDQGKPNSSPMEEFRSPAPLVEPVTTAAQGEAGALGDDQRDGWDDLDTAMLGLDLGQETSADARSSKAASDTHHSDRAPVPSGKAVETPTQDGDVHHSAATAPSSPDLPTNASTIAQQEDKEVVEAAGVVVDTPDEVKPLKDASTIQITANSRLEDIQAVMGHAGMATIHTRGLGANPFGRTHVHGYKGVAFEVMRNGYMASMTLF